MDIDASAFLQACREEMAAARMRQGIGTLGEKTQHAVLKRLFGPDEASREVRVGPYVADVFGPEGIVEIQTRGFDRLREKLPLFLQAAPVTVVYPVAQVKWLIKCQADGAMAPRRRSPRPGKAWDILPELYKIKPLLGAPGLAFCLLLMEVEEYRLERPSLQVGRKRTACYERMPVGLLGQVWLRNAGDFAGLLPPGLGEAFGSQEVARLGKTTRQKAQVGLNVLRAVGAVELAGKQGRANLYRPAPQFW